MRLAAPGSLAVALAATLACAPRPDRDRGAAAEAGSPASEVRLELEPSRADPGFVRATRARDFVLPEDHGPHYGYQTEWWYYTGQVADAGGRRFGFQLTFFRRGLSPGPPPSRPGLATNQVYFAHLALTDVRAGTHAFFERWARGAGGLAGATADSFAVWLEDWRAESTSRDGSSIRLTARAGAVALDLALDAVKPLVAHGERGLSAKSEEDGNASYYVGYTRMAVRGRLASGPDADPFEVTGEAWFDHEWSTSALGPGAVGWDWLSLQLDDGRELMYFRIRREDGSVEPASEGTLVARDGTTRRLLAPAVELEALASWTSPTTGARYPAKWRLRIAEVGVDLEVAPLVDDQEMRTSFVYWEGAVTVSGTADGEPVGGHGYVELTGYSGSMSGVF